MLSEFDISNYESFKDTIMQPVASIILNNQSPRIILVLYKLASQYMLYLKLYAIERYCCYVLFTFFYYIVTCKSLKISHSLDIVECRNIRKNPARRQRDYMLDFAACGIKNIVIIYASAFLSPHPHNFVLI